MGTGVCLFPCPLVFLGSCLTCQKDLIARTMSGPKESEVGYDAARHAGYKARGSVSIAARRILVSNGN